MEQKLQSNIWKYAIFLITNKRIFVAILGAYYLTIPGVTPKGMGLILLLGSLAGFIFEIPSGYVSDKIGHKAALVLSRILALISTLLFLLANNIVFLILASIFLSVSHAFHSGTGSAFIHETLRGLRRENDYAQVMGKVGAIGFAVPIVLTVITPFLVSVSFKTPFLIALIIDLIGVLVALSLTTPAISQEEIDEIRLTNFRQVMGEGYRLNFFAFAIFSGVMSGILFSLGIFRAAYQLFLEVPVIWYGVFFGVGRVFASIMLAYSGKLKEKTSIFSFYRFELILFLLLILSLGFVANRQLVVLIFIVINAFQWGLSRIDNSYLIDLIKTSKFKATLLSTRSQIDLIVAAFASFSLGLMIDKWSYSTSFLFIGIALAVILLPLYLYITKKHPQSRLCL